MIGLIRWNTTVGGYQGHYKGRFTKPHHTVSMYIAKKKLDKLIKNVNKGKR